MMVIRSCNFRLFLFIVLYSISKAAVFTQAKPKQIEAVWHLVQESQLVKHIYPFWITDIPTNQLYIHTHTDAPKSDITLGKHGGFN